MVLTIAVTALVLASGAVLTAAAARQLVLATGPRPADLFTASQRPQTPADLAGDVELPQQVERASIRRVAVEDGITYSFGVNADHTTCFSAVSRHQSSGVCTVGSPMGEGSELSVAVESLGIEATLAPNGYNAVGLRQDGYERVAPNLWVLRATKPAARDH